MTWFYLSFASELAKCHLGSTVVEATDRQHALQVARVHGVNPGGEVLMEAIPADQADLPELVMLRYRLWSKRDLLATGKFGTAKDLGIEGPIVCEGCNADAGKPEIQ